MPEEMSQTLLTNKKQGNLDQVHTANIIKPMQSRINRDKYTFCVIKSLGAPKKFKNWPRPLFMPRELTMHVLKNQIHLLRQFHNMFLCLISDPSPKFRRWYRNTSVQGTLFLSL